MLIRDPSKKASMFRFLLVAVLLASGSAFSSTPKKTTRDVLKSRDYQYSFDEYCVEFGKSYSGAEYTSRKATFEASLNEIKVHNEAISAPTWFMGVNEHTDKSAAEWKKLKGLHRDIFHRSFKPGLLGAPKIAALSTNADSLDWRDSGVVTPVKNQESCGSCWAFSATETVESGLAMASLAKGGNPTLVELAPQQLVDCAPNPQDCGGTGGCEGSTQPVAFTYVMSAGMVASQDYPYTARDGKCKSSLTPVVGIKGQVDIPTNSYNATINALNTAGPIAISVDASWGSYESGVYSPGRSGINTNIDHAVQLVGYGTENGIDYWLVRNSWGTSWGENGYIKLQKFGDGKEPCGTDNNPGDGFGCKGGASEITVCGTSGMLSGSSYTTGAFLE